MNGFLPISRADMQQRGWHYPDFLLVTGDAYVDHPSFGTAIISRVLENAGYRVAILAQPDFRSEADFVSIGRPRYAVLINSGNIDSMVAHYTAAKKHRSDDAYTPGGRAGARPDRAATVYAMLARRAFPGLPVYLGGLEASLRRFAHYDYWADRVMPSILESACADGLMYGMSERSVLELAENLKRGKKGAQACIGVRGTAYFSHPSDDLPLPAVSCPSFDEVCASKAAYARSVKVQYDEQDAVHGRAILQLHGKRIFVQNPPAKPLTQSEMDAVYALPYMRAYHPSYEALGGVPAIEEVQFSIIHNRGCFGACNFCALAFHQGRYISSRSHESVLTEARQIAAMPNFKGYIHDVGGPTANFRQPSCKKQDEHGLCRDKHCLFPTACKNLEADHADYLNLLRAMREIKGVKKVFVRSGLRYDYMMADHNDTFFRELIEHHISGQLKVAPEHISDNALYYMGKPSFSVYESFRERYAKINQKLGRKQYLVPYLMSSHPGATLEDAIELACYLNKISYTPEQVQDFYPTPGTLSTAMYYTELDPRTMKPVYVAKTAEEKAMQRALLQYRRPDKRPIVLAALKQAGREDLIGFEKTCLLHPSRSEAAAMPRPAAPTKPTPAERVKTKRDGRPPLLLGEKPPKRGVNRLAGAVKPTNAKPQARGTAAPSFGTSRTAKPTGAKPQATAPSFGTSHTAKPTGAKPQARGTTAPSFDASRTAKPMGAKPQARGTTAPSFDASRTAKPTGAKPQARGTAAPSFGASRTAKPMGAKPQARGTAAPSFGTSHTAKPTGAKPQATAPSFGASRTAKPTGANPQARRGTAAPSFGASRTAKPMGAKPQARGTAAPSFGASRTAKPMGAKPQARGTAAPSFGASHTAKPMGAKPQARGTAAPSFSASRTAKPTGAKTKARATAAPSFGTSFTVKSTAKRPASSRAGWAKTKKKR